MRLFYNTTCPVWRILQVLDQWVFEAILILSGFFGVESQASILILMNIASLCFRVSAGID
jgi:hypothetical protein